MAKEGFLSGLTGNSEESGEDADLAPTGLDPLAAAASLNAAPAHPGLAEQLGAYIDRQRRLVEIQTEHLHEQRALLLSHLRQRRIADWARTTTTVLVAAIAGCFVLLLAFLVIDAFASGSVVVESFDTPAGLTARGLSGRVVAGAVLDQFTRVQAATYANAEKRNLASAWTNDIKVEVPETGISLGDIDRLLKARFGHDLHVGGDLVQSENGDLTLTIRGDDLLPKAFSGGPGDLANLSRQAAEYIYAQSQPSLYAEFLLDAGRSDEALSFIQAALATAPAAERPYLLNAWGNTLLLRQAPPAEQMPFFRAALALKPDYWRAWMNIGITQLDAGSEESAFHTFQALETAAGGRPGHAEEIYFFRIDMMLEDWTRFAASMSGDLDRHAGRGSLLFAANSLNGVVADLFRHDPDNAAWRLAASQWGGPRMADLRLLLTALLAAERQDLPAMHAAVVNFLPILDGPLPQNLGGTRMCWMVPVLEQAGYPQQADIAAIKGGHFVDCARFHADTLDARGDWPAAQRAYADAVAMAPDLPAAYYSLGLALARHHDQAGAIEKLTAANFRGPHWAEPLKAWGDILAGQGKWQDAEAKYDAALKFAPHWQALQKARAAAQRSDE